MSKQNQNNKEAADAVVVPEPCVDAKSEAEVENPDENLPENAEENLPENAEEANDAVCEEVEDPSLQIYHRH